MTKALVTGGAGFIGSFIVEKLLDQGFDVTVADDLSHSDGSNIEKVADSVTWVNGNLLDDGVLEEAVRGNEYIFHLAANTSVNKSLAEPSWSARQNIMVTVRLLELAAKHKVKRVIFSSSAAVYGYAKDLPLKESLDIVPASPYALEKITCENYMKLFSSLHGLDAVSLRYFNVYGPRQNADLPHPGGVTIVVRQTLETGKSQLLGDGRQTRDMIYVGDVAEANILAMRKQGRCNGAVYNVSTARSVYVSDMHDMISKIMGVKPAREFLPMPEGNIMDSLGDNSLARKELGFSVGTGLEEGLRKTVEWYKQSVKPA